MWSSLVSDRRGAWPWPRDLTLMPLKSFNSPALEFVWWGQEIFLASVVETVGQLHPTESWWLSNDIDCWFWSRYWCCNIKNRHGQGQCDTETIRPSMKTMLPCLVWLVLRTLDILKSTLMPLYWGLLTLSLLVHIYQVSQGLWDQDNKASMKTMLCL